MRLVVDTNRVIASLIKNSFSRKIIFSQNLELITPDYTITEIDKYRGEIIKKSGINNKEFKILMLIILNKIKIIPKNEYEEFIEEAKKLIKDLHDIPFVALALAFNCDIWSDDRDFLSQKNIKIWRTKDFIK